MVSRCPSCGSPTRDDERVCPSCGWDFVLHQHGRGEKEDAASAWPPSAPSKQEFTLPPARDLGERPALEFPLEEQEPTDFSLPPAGSSSPLEDAPKRAEPAPDSAPALLDESHAAVEEAAP